MTTRLGDLPMSCRLRFAPFSDSMHVPYYLLNGARSPASNILDSVLSARTPGGTEVTKGCSCLAVHLRILRRAPNSILSLGQPRPRQLCSSHAIRCPRTDLVRLCKWTEAFNYRKA